MIQSKNENESLLKQMEDLSTQIKNLTTEIANRPTMYSDKKKLIKEFPSYSKVFICLILMVIAIEVDPKVFEGIDSLVIFFYIVLIIGLTYIAVSKSPLKMIWIKNTLHSMF